MIYFSYPLWILMCLIIIYSKNSEKGQEYFQHSVNRVLKSKCFLISSTFCSIVNNPLKMFLPQQNKMVQAKVTWPTFYRSKCSAAVVLASVFCLQHSKLQLLSIWVCLSLEHITWPTHVDNELKSSSLYHTTCPISEDDDVQSPATLRDFKYYPSRLSNPSSAVVDPCQAGHREDPIS